MDALHVVERIDELFNIRNKEIYSNESGITYNADKKVNKIGYCVNLTLELVKNIENLLEEPVKFFILSQSSLEFKA